jgi:hypothetical protein
VAIFICGNSHVAALQRGLTKLDRSSGDVTIFPLGNGFYELTDFSGVKNGEVILTDPTYARNFETYAGQNHFDSSHIWGLCMGTHTARIYRNHMWVDSAPADMGGSGARPISEAVLDAIVDADQKYIKLFMSRLKSHGLKFFCISCPALRSDHPCFKSGILPEVGAFVDSYARERFKGWLKEQRIDFVDMPRGSVDAHGFLRPRYRQLRAGKGRRDPHHANAAYGKLMMQRVFDYLEKAGIVG